jgi:methylase of polypeptide subunit release factors
VHPPSVGVDGDFPEAMDLIRRHESIRDFETVVVDGIELCVTSGVLSPSLTSTSRFFAKSILEVLGSGSVLEVGCGSGYVLLALGQARSDLLLHGCDVEAGALELAATNLARGGVTATLTCSDVFSAFDEAAVFDCILFNPPLLHGTPSSALERAIFDPEGATVASFVAGLRARLAPDGEAFLLYTNRAYTDYSAQTYLADVCRRHGVAREPVSMLDRGFERYTLWRLTVARS